MFFSVATKNLNCEFLTNLVTFKRCDARMKNFNIMGVYTYLLTYLHVLKQHEVVILEKR